jgi:glutathione peroxidase
MFFISTIFSFLRPNQIISQEQNDSLGSVHSFKVKTIDGEEKSLSDYKGKILLIVNTASQCGFTPQYEDLEKLQKQFEEKNFLVLGFPSNDFGGQEPGNNKEIKDFCKLKYGVTFQMFEKGSVRGEEIQPLFKFLTNEANPDLTGTIKWNFEKFLINQDGKLIERFGSFTNPLSGKVTRKIQELIQ